MPMRTATDVMTPHPVSTGADDSVAQALQTMRARGVSALLVAHPAGALAYGMLTMRDIIAKVVTHRLDPDAVKAGEVATWRVVTASPSWTLQEVAAQMAHLRVRRLPVTEGQTLIGLVSDTDLLTALVPEHEWEQARVVRRERAWRRAEPTGAVSTVHELMSAPVLSIGAAATVQEAVEKMVAAGVASLLVSADGDPSGGIITKRDIVTKVLAGGANPVGLTVGAVMSSPVLTIHPGATIEACSARMSAEGVRRLPVREETDMIGIISDSDILAAVAARRWSGHQGRRWPTAHIVADIMQPVDPDAEANPAGGVVPELSVWECAALLACVPARNLPVVQEGRVIGFVRRADIQRVLEERGASD